MLTRTLPPLLNQVALDRPYEVIVVDNSSTDATAEVVGCLALRHSNLRYVDEVRLGAAAARNTGISRANGDLIIFVDDDIVVFPDHLARHVAYHESSTYPICVVGHIQDKTTIHSDLLSDYVHSYSTKREHPSGRRMPGLALAGGNFSVARDALTRIAFQARGRTQYFDESFLRRQDGELGYRLERAGVTFQHAADIQCEHYHVYTRCDMARRVYLAGYYLRKLYTKHPELQSTAPYKIVSSPLCNTLLLLTSIIAILAGYLARWATPTLLHKGIGGLLVYQASRGYQQAAKEADETVTNCVGGSSAE